MTVSEEYEEEDEDEDKKEEEEKRKEVEEGNVNILSRDRLKGAKGWHLDSSSSLVITNFKHLLIYFVY